MEASNTALGHNNPPSDAEILQSKLNETHAKILNGAKNLLDMAAHLPATIEDDDAAGRAGDYIKEVTGAVKTLETARVSEKEPFLSQGRVVDGFFKKTTDALSLAKLTAERPLGVFLKNKAAAEQRRRAEEAAELRRQQDEQTKAAKMLEDAKMQPQAETMLDQATITEQVAIKVEQSVQARPADMAQSRGNSGSLASLRTRWVGELTDQATVDLERLRHHLNPDALQKAVNSFVAAGGRDLRGANIFEKSDPVVR